MITLVERIKSAECLMPIRYESPNIVVLEVDSSYIGVGWILYQMNDEGKKILSRFGSLTFNAREMRYSQAKLELFGLYRVLRTHIFGVRNLEVWMDASYVKEMLNHPEDIPTATMNRWVEGILMFVFKFKHVPALRMKGADGLSRRESGRRRARWRLGRLRPRARRRLKASRV